MRTSSSFSSDSVVRCSLRSRVSSPFLQLMPTASPSCTADPGECGPTLHASEPTRIEPELSAPTVPLVVRTTCAEPASATDTQIPAATATSAMPFSFIAAYLH